MHKFINELKDGDTLTNEVYLVQEKTLSETSGGKPYVFLTVMDKTGNIKVKCWDDAVAINANVNTGDYISITGIVQVYNGKTEIKNNKLSIAAPGSYFSADYMPTSRKNLSEMKQNLARMIGSVTDPHLNRLLNNIFKNPELNKVFFEVSAAKQFHQNFIHGLLEHTLNVAEICDLTAKKYPMLDRDMLITAALLHDIGKTKELSLFPENDYTDDGKLLGHIVIGVMMIEKEIDQIADFPAEKRLLLEHCIVGHHGKMEWGSPEVPKTGEAEALHLADMIDSRMAAFENHLFLNNPTEDGWLPKLGSFGDGKGIKISDVNMKNLEKAKREEEVARMRFGTNIVEY